jgi:hypothetical protein
MIVGSAMFRMVAVLAACLGLLACGSSWTMPAKDPGKPSGDLVDKVEPMTSKIVSQITRITNRKYSAEEKSWFPINNYRKFPDKVRASLQRADIENAICRGNSGDNPETLRACNRREILMLDLEDWGWCYGSKEHIGAMDHWWLCVNEDNFRPGEHRKLVNGFSDKYIATIEDMNRVKTN